MARRRKVEPRLTAQAQLVDTNVLLRYLIGDDPPKAARTVALMERVERAEVVLEIPDEAVTETVWTLESFYRVPRAEIAQHLIELLGFAGVRVSSRDIVRLALKLFATSNADFVDCMLASRSRCMKVPVYTFDETDLEKLGITWEAP